MKRLAIMFPLLLLLSACGVGERPEAVENADAPAAEVPRKPGESEAYIMSKHVVENVLKAPATADFPWAADKVVANGDTFNVLSHVDAQNAYGANLRNQWTTAMVYNGGEWTDLSNWTVLFLQIEDEIYIGKDYLAKIEKRNKKSRKR